MGKIDQVEAAQPAGDRRKFGAVVPLFKNLDEKIVEEERYPYLVAIS